MNSFLKKVATDLIDKYGTDLAHLVIVFPNKRASLFLNQEIAQLTKGATWSPSYTTISELFKKQSTLLQADAVKSIFELYKSYCKITGSNEDIDQFYGWGELMLSDFDDIDKNLAEAKQVFKNIRDIHELDSIAYLTEKQKTELQRFFSNFTGNDEGIKKKFLTLWCNLSNIYHDFQDRLRKQGLAYEGMLYRDVIEKGLIDIKYKKYIFVGFNVLQKVEQKLFDIYKEAGVAAFYWDYDEYYLNSQNEAGNYIKKWLHKYPNELSNDDRSIYNNFSDTDKEITFISCPTENIQGRYVADWLIEKNRYSDGKRTAIILCNEGLLPTVIHSFPTEVKELNVTMGYPLQYTPIASMVTYLLSMQDEGYSKRDGAFRLKYINKVVRHPYAKYLIDNYEELVSNINKSKKYYISKDDGLDFPFIGTSKALLPSLLDWLAKMVRKIGINSVEVKDDLFKESVFQMYTLLNKITELVNSGDVSISYTITKRLLKQLIGTTNIPFHGEPAKGIQVMGVLETRNLDFDHVLLLSCNEGYMPKNAADNSFIPHFIKKAYDLTTIDNKISIYAYYFYRLLQRAKDITMLYNNAVQVSKVGEMSRFMLQLMVEYHKSIQRLTLKTGYQPYQTKTACIKKDKSVIEKLNSISFFSPTAITTYIKCPLMYYYKYIGGLKEEDYNDEDIIDNRIFGNIFHHAAQLMYEQLFSKDIITKEQIEYVLKTEKSLNSNEIYKNATLDSILTEAFAQELFLQNNNIKSHPKLNGLQLINREVIKKYLRKLLKIDASTAPIRIINHEFNVHKTIAINVNDDKKDIKIGGIVDRLDMLYPNSATPQLRVVDYKTGASTTKSVSDIEALFTVNHLTQSKSDYMIQSMLYSWIVANDTTTLNVGKYPVSPALLFIQKAKTTNYSPIIELKKEPIMDIKQYEEEFLAALTSYLEELHNIDVDFYPTQSATICNRCSFKSLCGK